MERLDAWRTAKALIEEHGDLAEDRVCDRLGEACVSGDVAECTASAQILAALNKFRRGRLGKE
jgi:hypothetical protein